VILSIDAARTDITYDLSSQDVLPGFKRMIDLGVYSEGMIVSFPSATAVSHAVISTGADPSVTGITGNSIHFPGLRVDKTVSGFDGRYLLAEPIWMAADRQGMRAVVASFPQSTPGFWSGKVKSSVLFDPYSSLVSPISYSALYTTNKNIAGASYVSFTVAENWRNLQGLGAVYKPHQASVRLGDSVWWLLVYDSNNDGVLDKLAIVPNEKDASQSLAILSEGEWSKPLNTTITTHVVAPLLL